MSKAYYQDELNYLRELGKEFSERYPDTAHMLGSGASDPDVERLLQGFAFLTAQLHEKLDNQNGEIAEGFLQTMWPEALKATPPRTIVEFTPDKNQLNAELTVPAGTYLDSKRYSWGRHRFRTCRDVHLLPLRVKARPELLSKGDATLLRLPFAFHPGASPENLVIDELILHLHSQDPRMKYDWFLWLTQFCRSAVAVSKATDRHIPVTLEPSFTRPGTSLDNTGSPELPGYEHLRRFLILPEEMLFLTIRGIGSAAAFEADTGFDLLFDFGTHHPPGSMHNMDLSLFRLHCTPVENLFPATARLRLDHTRTEYVVRPNDIDVEHVEVTAVESVKGVDSSSIDGWRIFTPYLARATSLQQPTQSAGKYRVRFADIQARRRGQPLVGRDCFLSFSDDHSRGLGLTPQTVAIDLICCHRGGTRELAVGELNQPTEGVPASLTFTNILPPTEYHPAPDTAKNFWLLISCLNLSRRSVTNLTSLQATLDFLAKTFSPRYTVVRRQIENLSAMRVKPIVTIQDGTPARVLDIEIQFDCDPTARAEAYAFGLAISEMLGQIATINTRLRIRITFRQDMSWQLVCPQRNGTLSSL